MKQHRIILFILHFSKCPSLKENLVEPIAHIYVEVGQVPKQLIL